MSIPEFVQLSTFEKICVINSLGTFIAERRVGLNRVYLYAITHFYVELFHELSNPGASRRVRIHRVFEDTAYLDGYLEEVDINWLKELIS